MMGCEYICLFQLSQSLDKVLQKYIKAILQFQHNQQCKNCKFAKSIDEAKTIYHVICSWWLSFGTTTKHGILGLSEWLEFWHFCYRQLGGYMIIISVASLYICYSFLLFKFIIYIKSTIICIMFVGYDYG